MERIRIAVVGSIDSSRPELDLKNADQAAPVLQEIGKALAASDCDIVVYSNNPIFAEPHVVKGYVASGKAVADSIRVIYPRHVAKPDFPEQKANDQCFWFHRDENKNWEVSFYRSLHDVDGVIILGGGQSTFIAGILSTTRRAPIIALEAFGGAGSKVWELLNPHECPSLTAEMKSAMAELSQSPDWARRVVEGLLEQRNRQLAAARQTQESEARRRRRLGGQAVAGVAMLALAVALFVTTWDNHSLSRMLLLAFLVAAPALAGMSASVVRSFWEEASDRPDSTQRGPLVMASLGFVSGLLAGLLYLVAQLTAFSPTDFGGASRLIPFALLTGFLAGFAADAFFRKLRDRDIGPVEIAAFARPRQDPS